MSAVEPIVVIGGGIIGCCTAYHLLEAGAHDVTVLDALEPGAATTGAAAGFVSQWSPYAPQFGHEGLALQRYALEFYRRLSEREDIGFHNNGTLNLALSARGFAQFLQPARDNPFGVQLSTRSPDEVGELTHGLVDTREIYVGLYDPRGIQLEAELAVEALGRWVEERGAKLRTAIRVLELRERPAGVEIITSRETFPAAVVILAAGAWSNELLRPLEYRLPLLRLLASRIVTNSRGLPACIPTLQCKELRLWLRESLGAITWGSVRGYVPLEQLSPPVSLAYGRPHHPELLERLREQQHAALERIFPPLRHAAVARFLQGVPCYTPDHNLLLGALPGHPRILVAAGDNETGVSHGPGLGRVLAETALQRAPFIDARRFRLERFAPQQYPTEAAVAAALAGLGALALPPERAPAQAAPP